MRRPLSHTIEGLRLKVTGADGGAPRSLFDFSTLELPDPLAYALLKSHVALQGGNTIESQRFSWRHLRTFGTALRNKCPSENPLRADCLVLLDLWLEKSKLAPKTQIAIHNTVCRSLRWCLRNHPQTIDPKVRLFPLANPPTKKEEARISLLDENVMKAALRACYVEIEEIEARFEKYRALPLEISSDQEADLLLRLLQIGNGNIPKKSSILRMPGGSSLIGYLVKYGGFREFVSRYLLMGQDVFPYFFAILIQTSANPQSLLEAERDCLHGHPLREDLERIVFAKNRARRDQIPDFPRDKAWSAPNLARRLIEMTDDLVALAPAKFRRRLFLCQNLAQGVGTPSWQSIHDYFALFRKKHGLPNFHLSDYRKAGGRLHHLAGRSVVAAQKRLNHRDTRTTEIYTPLSDRATDHRRTILKFQGLLVQEAASTARENTVAQQTVRPVAAAETVFGFGCSDPTGGVAPGSRNGEVCTQFHHCATCTGAIVTVDDVGVVARILAAKEALLAAQSRAFREGWGARFRILYEPVMGIIERDILPFVSGSVLAKAQAMPKRRVIHLE